MKQLPTAVTEIDVESVRVFVHRTRDRAKFEQVKQAIAEVGLKVPIQVRDIRHLPKDERRRPQGGFYSYELARGGEGRLLAHKELGRKKIPALIVELSESELVGGFLAENMIRKPLPWSEKAKLVKAELDAGSTVDEVARKFVITRGHVYKFQRILAKSAKNLEDEIAALPMNAAELVTSLPEGEQGIVFEVLRETSAPDVREVARKAKEISEKQGTLTKPALVHALRSIDNDLKQLRSSLKLARLHHALSIQNLQVLLRNPKFKAELKRTGVNLARIEEITR